MPVQPLFPARAGVIPGLAFNNMLLASFPRASGGNSLQAAGGDVLLTFSPRERG